MGVNFQGRGGKTKFKKKQIKWEDAAKIAKIKYPVK
jgi:hypothetical protein